MRGLNLSALDMAITLVQALIDPILKLFTVPNDGSFTEFALWRELSRGDPVIDAAPTDANDAYYFFEAVQPSVEKFLHFLLPFYEGLVGLALFSVLRIGLLASYFFGRRFPRQEIRGRVSCIKIR